MAELKIEKKKPVWPWILLGLIILAVILYFVLADNDTDDVDDVDDNTEQIITSEPEEDYSEMDTATWEDDNLSGDDSVSKYVAHIGDTEKMGIDHKYSSEALILLVNALENRAEEANINTDVEMQELKSDVRDIKEDPQSLDHANSIKNVGMKIVSLMDRIQNEKFPNISQDVQEVRTAVQNIQPSTPTLDQKDAMNSFYKEAGDVLQKMKMS
ncbi:hypothetical protein [Gillisia limnaea]|uniref:Uncharacterized protein n=1 Tax=Gillisia limnaea (strain DSM 15749 / LMG 21470 / R-8282) TaxID=865937 RepID=H2BWB7_GILLR|nr:hypothetical protein [Gillisia limnaea]EHQ04081.1 hypothetical protein Gilli_3484 [Gillisia limnaea DSM 15749]